MFVTILPILVFSAVNAISEYEGVNPNNLSCDPRGEKFLLLPHHSDCTKFFMCAHGREVEFTCSAQLYFDFVLQTCNWPRDTKCWLRTPPGEDNDGSGDNDGSEEEEEEDGSEGDDDGSGDIDLDWFAEKFGGSPVEIGKLTGDSEATRTNTTHFKPNLNCLRTDSAAKQIPYLGDCQRYWRCVDGLPQAVYCSDGLFFNKATQQCDFEANAKCEVEVEDELKSEFIVIK